MECRASVPARQIDDCCFRRQVLMREAGAEPTPGPTPAPSQLGDRSYLQILLSIALCKRAEKASPVSRDRN